MEMGNGNAATTG